MSETVEGLLRKNNVTFTSSGKDYIVKCLNPGHEDNNPSCRIDKSTGATHCFSCGFKTNIFKHYKVFTTNVPSKIANLKEKLKDLSLVSTTVHMPENSIPFTEVYRGISRATYIKFEAFTTTHVDKLVDRVVFPIKDITGKIVAFLGRHRYSEASPKYEITPSGRPLPCYPAKVPDGTTSLVLVEGIFDMLNLYDKGIRNVACVFGTNTITEKTVEAKLLGYKIQGIVSIYILFDGDTPGREAAKALKPLIEEQGFIVEILPMEDGTDPGDMSAEDIQTLKSKLQ